MSSITRKIRLTTSDFLLTDIGELSALTTRVYKRRYEKHHNSEPKLQQFSVYQETVTEGGLIKS